MVSLFENYEQQYSVLTADITAQVGLLTASATKDRRQLISNIEKHVEEAQELLEQMELEVREGALYDSAEELNDIRIPSDQKQRLLDNSETIERTGRKLEEGYRVIVETQEIGTQVLKNLGDQRETMQRSRTRLREADEELGRSGRIMNSMIMRSIQQKLVLFAVCACFLIAICLGIYLGFTRN
ncbi:hypothetical protein NQ314_010356 [Rhamnusium bicolor]|uniref:Vesicle transport through interaction with t-SNAREs homolog 1A n=1 Tax=Rhamnusium bicolor TaxID=1586634 RepID=A0AAV8XRL0_9CUCU|nr:hypothetical protein NQ314_010356 [Rhamnusium bicolor]